MSLIGQLPLAAIRLLCKDIKVSERFYSEVLGLKRIDEEVTDEKNAHYDAGSVRLTLSENATKIEGQKSTSSGYLIFVVENSLEEVINDLTKRGVKFRSKKVLEDSTGKVAWFSDPDGNVIYLWQPPRRDSKNFRSVEGIVRHYESVSRALADLREEEAI